VPALIPFALGYVAGVAAGLVVSWASWLGAPLAAAVAAAGWRRAPLAATLATAFAAGALWGGLARAGNPGCAARLPAPCVAPADTTGLRARLASRAEQHLTELFGPARGAVAAALTVDPEARVPREERQAFARAGLAHLLSISGFHVGILAAALVLLLRAARVPPDRARVAGVAAVAGYVWLLGAPAPAVRAAALLALWSWSRARQRPAARFAGIAVTAMAVVTLDPFTLVRPGPWLSFSGAWGSVAAAGWWRRLGQRVPLLVRQSALRVVGQAVIVSAGAVLATMPVTILAFGTFAPIAVVANLAAVPLAALTIPTVALSLALASLPGGMALATVTAAAGGLGLDLLQRVAEWAAAAPGAGMIVEQRVPVAVVAAAVAVLLLRRVSPVSRRPLGGLLLGRLLPAALLTACAVVWLPPHDPGLASGDGKLALFFLDVGQGDGALLRTPHGRWIAIDAGPRTPVRDAGSAVVVPFLRREHVGRLAMVIVSHDDADHIGGMPSVLAALRADVALDNGQADPRPLYIKFLGEVEERAARWHSARAGDVFSIDGVTFRVWHPDSAWLARELPANENSVVLTVEYGAFRAVFTGDAGVPMETVRAGEIGHVTLLKVGHHGSRSATSDRWLAALTPELCVISVGAHNLYGHPDPGTLVALDNAHCAVRRTDRSGTIEVETDGRALSVHPERGADTSLAVPASASR